MKNTLFTKENLRPMRFLIAALMLTVILAGTVGYFIGSTGDTGPSATHDHTAGEAGEEETQLWTCGMHPWIVSEEPGLCPICEMDLVPMKNEQQESGQQSAENEILYWRAPMDPTEIYDNPGKSKMGMDLVPVYANEVVGGVEIRIDPVTQQNMGLRTAPVEKGPLVTTIRTYGHVTYDETRTAQVSPKFNGWIEEIYVDFKGQFINKGDKLFDIYSPELLTAQEEYLVAYKNLKSMKDKRQDDLLASAKRRLLYLDVPEDEIEKIERAGRTSKTITIRSPFTGVVTTNNAEEGVFVKAGAPLYQISDLSTVWVEAHIFEYELPWVELGQEAVMSLPYLPGKEFHGKVMYIYPYLQKETRDVVVRLEFDNPAYQLKPDMYADIKIKAEPRGEGLVIPSEAIIRSGERNIVFVDRGNGKFAPRETTLGLTLENDRVQVLSGLAPGDRVVTSGQFLLDSESKLKEAVQKMLESKKPVPEAEKVPEPAPAGEDDFFEDMGEEQTKDDFFSDME